MRIASTPASIAAANGTSSRSAQRRHRRASTRRRPRCVSALVSPWPGKCFAHTLMPPSWKPVDRRDDVPRHDVGGRAERAHADDGVARIRVDVRARRERQVDAERRGIAARGRRSASAVSSHVVDEAERGRARACRCPSVASRRVTSPPSSSMAITTSPRASCSCVAQLGDLCVVDHVLGEQQHATESVADRARAATPGPRADERAQHARRPRAGGRRGAHPFTAPAVSPLATRRWTSRKKIDHGNRHQRRAGHDAAPVGALARPR